MAARLVPVNYSAQHFVSHPATSDDQKALAPPAAPPADQLANWAMENYSLDVNVAADLGFPVGSLKADARTQVLLFGASRSADVPGDDGHIYRFGVSLRALIEVIDLKAEGSLTVPMVAAKVELRDAIASAQLMVRGYKGAALGGMLPQWQSFGVDSYTAYMRAVSDIQSKIMADQVNISPELLATTALAPSLPPSETSVGMFYALDAISRRLNLLDALKNLNANDEGRLGLTVRTVYSRWIGSDSDKQQPDEQTAQRAGHELGDVRARHGLLAGVR